MSEKSEKSEKRGDKWLQDEPVGKSGSRPTSSGRPGDWTNLGRGPACRHLAKPKLRKAQKVIKWSWTQMSWSVL